MIQKSILVLMLSCTSAGYFIGDDEFGMSIPFFSSEVRKPAKKVSVVKPKFFKSKRRVSNDNSGFKSEQFSFFRVLNDPSLSRMVGLNGEVIKKYDFSPATVRKASFPGRVRQKISVTVTPVRIEPARMKVSISSTPPSTPKTVEVKVPRTISSQNQKIVPVVSPLSFSKIIEPKKVVLKQKPVEPLKIVSASPTVMESFVVQVSSFRTLQSAEAQRDTMKRKGYASFIGKKVLPDNKGTWYRVYIGRYFNHAGAEMAAAKFYREEKRKAMVIRQAG